MPLASTAAPPSAARRTPRPVLWVCAWAVYVLIALGWFGYEDALAGFICTVPR